MGSSNTWSFVTVVSFTWCNVFRFIHVSNSFMCSCQTVVHCMEMPYLGCFHFLAIIYITPCVFISLGYILGAELLGHMVILLLTFEDLPDYFLKWFYHFTFSSAYMRVLDFSTSSPVFVFDHSHPSGYTGVFHCGFFFPTGVLICISLMEINIFFVCPLQTAWF